MMATASIHLLRTHKMNLLGRVVGCASFAGIDAELLCLVELSLLKMYLALESAAADRGICILGPVSTSGTSATGAK